MWINLMLFDDLKISIIWFFVFQKCTNILEHRFEEWFHSICLLQVRKGCQELFQMQKASTFLNNFEMILFAEPFELCFQM